MFTCCWTFGLLPALLLFGIKLLCSEHLWTSLCGTYIIYVKFLHFRVERLWIIVDICSSFWETSRWFSKSVVSFCISTWSVWEISLFHKLSILSLLSGFLIVVFLVSMHCYFPGAFICIYLMDNHVPYFLCAFMYSHKFLYVWRAWPNLWLIFIGLSSC